AALPLVSCTVVDPIVLDPSDPPAQQRAAAPIHRDGLAESSHPAAESSTVEDSNLPLADAPIGFGAPDAFDREFLSSVYLDAPATGVWGEGEAKSYFIPAIEIITFQVLLNVINRTLSSSDDYDANFSTIWHNLHHRWVVDKDPFATNQFLHP